MKLLKGSEKYIAVNIFWQWISLLLQIAAVSAAGRMLQKLYEGQMTMQMLWATAGIVAAAVCLRFLGEKRAATASYMASADVKAVLRREIYEKLLRLGASYKECVPTSEIVQVSVEGVEQLEIYYGRYLPQLFYSLLTVPSGSFVSLAGVSGCGKSTIASLLTGRNRGFTGEVLINGIPVQAIPEACLMKMITLVSHNSYLFKGTVRENLLMADANATEEQMERALREVKLYEFLSVQNGLDTMIEEQGSNLSGGQRQRLAIARALLHDSPMYIFDEAASNIDVESEDQIMEVIRTLAKTKTVLFISHRLANTIGSDCIYMMESGQITESGTFAELIKNNEGFAAMYRAQQELCGQQSAGSGKAPSDKAGIYERKE